jgi:hypothetical protein
MLPETWNAYEFLFDRAEFCVIVYGGHLSISCKQVKIKRILIALLFVFLLRLTCETQKVFKM